MQVKVIAMELVYLGQRYIEVQILGGNIGGKRKLIPRILLAILRKASSHLFSYRTNFPLKFSFAMTVNKSQGQTLGIVGLDLLTSAFTQLQCHESLM